MIFLLHIIGNLNDYFCNYGSLGASSTTQVTSGLEPLLTATSGQNGWARIETQRRRRRHGQVKTGRWVRRCIWTITTTTFPRFQKVLERSHANHWDEFVCRVSEYTETWMGAQIEQGLLLLTRLGAQWPQDATRVRDNVQIGAVQRVIE